MKEYLDPTGCPGEKPQLKNMAADTRALHDAIDRVMREQGVPYLHPAGASIQLDMLGSQRVIAWQEGKAEAVFSGDACWSQLPQIYGRYGVESSRTLIATVRKLEQAAGAIVTDCGMQACALLFDVLLQPGSHAVVLRQVYNKAKKHLEWLAQRTGSSLTFVDGLGVDELERAVRPTTRLVFYETYSNPLTRALDPEELGAAAARLRAAKAPGLHLVVDDTVASPWGLKKPLLSYDGIHAVVASGTKSLAGQDRDLWGYVAANDLDLMNEVMDLEATRGGGLDWRRAEAIVAGLDRARDRFEQRCSAATRVAGFLAGHPRVEKVFHPSLSSHVDAETVRKHYRLPGSLVAFRVAGLSEDGARHFADVLATTTVPRYALSFDGLSTKINHHVTVSEYFTPADELARCGFDRILRLGVGTEHPDDLIACLNWALWHHDSVDAQEVAAWQRQRTEDLGIYQEDAKP